MAKKGVSVGVEITGQAKGFQAAADDAKKATEALKNKAKKDTNSISGAFQKMGGAVGRAIRDMLVGFKALMANPIALAFTALIGVLAGVVKAFKSTDSGATEFAARMEQVRSVIDVVRQRLVKVGDAIKHVFKGEWKEAGEAMKGVFKGIGDQMREATDAAYAYAKAMDVLEDSQNNYISQSAEMRNKIAKLEFIAQDRNRTTTERRNALKEAIRLGEQETREQQRFAKQRLDNEAKYLAEKNGLRTEDVIGFIRMTDAEQASASAALKTLRNNNEKKFIELENYYAAWIDLDTKFYDENKRNISRLSGFELEQIKEREDALKELKKAYQDVYNVAYALPQQFSQPAKAPVKGAGMLKGGATLAGPPPAIQAMTEALEVQAMALEALDGMFQGMFMNVEKGFKGMVDVALSEIKRLITYMAAKMAVISLLNIIAPGSGMAVNAVSNFSKQFGFTFSPFASGGIVSGPTLAKVGEYANAKSNPEVIAPLSKLKGMLGNEMKVKIEGVTRGSNIYWSNARYANILNAST